MSSALGRACSGAARRLAASQRLGGGFSGARSAVSFPADRPRGSGGSGGAGDEGEQWKRLRDAGEKVNPCNSPLHPAVKAGTLAAADAPRLSVQAAYDPRGMCFGCGAWLLGAATRTLLQSQRKPFGAKPLRLLTRAFPRHAPARRTCAPRRAAHVVVSHRLGAADGGVCADEVPGAPPAQQRQLRKAPRPCADAPRGPRRSCPAWCRPASSAR